MKPCPFCNAAARIRYSSTHGTHCAQCTECGAETDSMPSEGHAFEAWEQRVEEDHLRFRIKRLSEAADACADALEAHVDAAHRTREDQGYLDDIQPAQRLRETLRKFGHDS